MPTVWINSREKECVHIQKTWPGGVNQHLVCGFEVHTEADSPVTSGVWNWSPSGPLIPARGCATSGTGALRLAGPVPSRIRPPRATRPGGSGAGPCSLSTTARIVSTPPYRFRRLSSQSNRVLELKGGCSPRTSRHDTVASLTCARVSLTHSLSARRSGNFATVC